MECRIFRRPGDAYEIRLYPNGELWWHRLDSSQRYGRCLYSDIKSYERHGFKDVVHPDLRVSNGL